MHRFRMLLHIRTGTLHYCCKLQQSFFLSFNLYFLISAYLEGGFSDEAFPISLIVLRSIIYFILYLGDLWSCYQGPQLSKLGFRGGVSIYNIPLSKLFIRLYLPKLGVNQLLLGPLVPLGTLVLMGPHVLVTRVWGTPIESN